MSKRTKRQRQDNSGKFQFEKMSAEQQRECLEKFAKELQCFLETKKGGRAEIMENVGVDIRNFEKLLLHLHQDGYLQIGYHRLSELADDLKKKAGFRDLEGITVVAGSDERRFARAAAEDFIKRMMELGRLKHQRKGEQPLNVGIVSGNTTGSVIREALSMKWGKDLQDAHVAAIPRIQVFALNVCLTVPKHLPGNATILAYQLAEKIKEEGGKADGYGLSAPLIVKAEGLAEVDEAPQTFEVLQFTEPYRVREKLRKMGKPVDGIKETDTDLDIVLTGVGELPGQGAGGQKGSIFYNLAKDHEFAMDSIIAREHIVGDIAFTAIKSDGTTVSLRKHDHPGGENGAQAGSGNSGEGTEYFFYSAVRVPILEAMAKEKDRSVILVARHNEEKYKVPAIFASIAGEGHRYASRLVIDEQTASKLCRY